MIRDSHGQAIAPLLEQTSLSFSSDIVETVAATRAISFAQELGITSYILEGDLESMIKALKTDEESVSPFGHIFALAKSTLASISRISFFHVCKLSNNVAHNLTRHARYIRGISVWMENVPPHLSFILFAYHGYSLFLIKFSFFLLKKEENSIIQV